MADSDSSDAARRRRLRHAGPRTYEVGYARPPAATRFQPGQSGNPKGRPNGAKNKLPALQEERLKSIVLEEAYRTIKVRDGDRNVTVPMAKAIIRTLAVNAAKGNNRAALLFSSLLQTTERENRELHNAWLDTAPTYKIEWDKELARRKRLGVDADDPIPHPDDIVVNPRTGKVSVLGPMTREEKWIFGSRERHTSARQGGVAKIVARWHSIAVEIVDQVFSATIRYAL